MLNQLFWIVPICSVIALLFAWFFFKGMMKESEGNETMKRIAGHVRKGIRRVKLPGLLQRLHVGNAVPQILLRHIFALAVFFHHRRYDLIRRAVRVKRNDVIGHLIHYMNGAGAGVQHDVVAVQLILMYHLLFSLYRKSAA